MNVSTKGRYGLTLMVELGLQTEGACLALKSIADRHDLSEHYLEQLISALRHAGLVRSVRGANGGYYLARLPQEISLGDILRAVEGPILSFAGAQDLLLPIWEDVSLRVNEVFNQVTLQEILERHLQGQNYLPMYYI